jgi:hypothetical protein
VKIPVSKLVSTSLYCFTLNERVETFIGSSAVSPIESTKLLSRMERSSQAPQRASPCSDGVHRRNSQHIPEAVLHEPTKQPTAAIVAFIGLTTVSKLILLFSILCLVHVSHG